MSKKKQLQHRLNNLFDDLENREETPFPNLSIPEFSSWSFLVDPDGQYLEVSPEITQCLGIQFGNFAGQSIFSYAISLISGKKLRKEFKLKSFPLEINVYFQSAEGVFIPAHVQLNYSYAVNGYQETYRGFVQVLSDHFEEIDLEDSPTITSFTTKDYSAQQLFNKIAPDFSKSTKIEFHQANEPLTEAGKKSLKNSSIEATQTDGNSPAAIAVPVDLKDQGIGVLELIDTSANRKWTEDDYLLVQEVANQLSLAIENAKLYNSAQNELSERMRAQQEILTLNKDLSSLNEYGQELSRITESKDIFILTQKIISKIIPNRNITIAVPEKNSNRIIFPISVYEGHTSLLPDRDLASGIADFVISNKQTIFLSKDMITELNTRRIKVQGNYPLCLLAVPMTVGERSLGAIILQDFQDTAAFTTSDQDLLSTIASQAAAALENANLFQEIREALEVIETREKYQSNVAHAVATLTKFGSNSIREVLESLGKASNASRIFFAQVREESVSPYWHQMAEWIHPDKRQEIRPIPGHNIVMEVFKDQIAILREAGWFSLKSNTNNEQTDRWMKGRQNQSILVMAVMGKTSVPSFIAFEDCYSNRIWHNEEIGFLRVAADALSNTFIREDLVDQLQVSLDETENLYNASHQLSLANSYDDMLQSITHGLYIPDINRGIIVIFNDDENETKNMRVVSNWHNGIGTPPPPIGAEYDVEVYNEIFQPDSPTYYDDVMAAGFNSKMADILSHQNIRSMAVLPLWSGKRRIGVILLQSENRHSFSNREKRTFPPLIDQMATSVENLLLFEQTQDALKETETLYKISDGISAASHPQELISAIASTIMPASADRATIMLLREQGSTSADAQLEIVGYFQKDRTHSLQTAYFQAQNFPALNSLLTSNLLIIEDLATSNLDEVSKKTLAENNIRGGCIVPLYSGGRMVGLLSTFSSRRFHITEDETRLLQIAANGIAISLERQKLLEDTQQRALELQTAAEIARDTTSTLSLEELLKNIVNLIAERFNFYHTAIFLIDEENKFVVIREASGATGVISKQQNLRLAIGSKSVVGTVAAKGEAVVINDATDHQLFFKSNHLPDTKSEIGLPLKIGDKVFGVLDIQSSQFNAFRHAEATVLQILADQIAIAIENARAYELSQKAIEDMREVDRIKSQFLANMSHELRTPLNSIIGFSRVILKGIDGPINDTQEQDLSAIYNSGQHLLRLINDILDLSKIEAGKMQLQIMETNIPDLINSVMSTAAGLIKDKTVKLDYIIPSNLPLVEVDQTRIRQVLLNFLSNAAKFTDVGTIVVEASEVISPANKPEVMITVTDTGPGIAEKDKVKLFQPFSQVDDSPTRKTGGTGLGLSICRSFIEMHNGRIGLLSSETGKGSVFYFTLPVKVEEENTQQPIPEYLSYSEKTILSIDDDKQITDLYERYLGSNGYQVVALNDPKSAVQRAKQVKPFAITLDVMMPGRDGWHIIQDLKNDPETCNIPVIMCTILEEEEKGFNLGAADYLIKPFLQEELLDAVNRLNFDGTIHKILVIDDSEDDQRLIARILEDHTGFEFSFANNGKEGLEYIGSIKPDAIILDLMMPEMNGFDFLDIIHEKPEYVHIPVVVLTGADLTPEQYQRLTQAGQQLLLKGLLGEKELLTTLENTLRLSSVTN
jgi:K+-sensing histidine kinase KdpD/CheY-like chemotaxis protein